MLSQLALLVPVRTCQPLVLFLPPLSGGQDYFLHFFLQAPLSALQTTDARPASFCSYFLFYSSIDCRQRQLGNVQTLQYRVMCLRVCNLNLTWFCYCVLLVLFSLLKTLHTAVVVCFLSQSCRLSINVINLQCNALLFVLLLSFCKLVKLFVALKFALCTLLMQGKLLTII